MEWKKTPPELAAKFDQAMPQDPRVVQKVMFGYPALFLNGNMFAFTFRDQIVVRLSDPERASAIKNGAKAFRADARTLDEGVHRGPRGRRIEAGDAGELAGAGTRLRDDATEEDGGGAEGTDEGDRQEALGGLDVALRLELRPRRERRAIGNLVDLRDPIEDGRAGLTGETDQRTELDRTGVDDLVRERTTTQSDNGFDRHQDGMLRAGLLREPGPFAISTG